MDLKYIIAIVLLAVYQNVSGQKSEPQYTLGGGVNVGLKKTGGGGLELIGEILNDKGKKFNSGINIGLGVLLPMESPVSGDDYNGILLEVDREDLMHKGIMKDPGFYAQAGYTFYRFTLGGRVGSYTKSYYEQGFNSIMGLHHITWSRGDYLIYGWYANIKVFRWLAICGGYDNYSEEFLGINFRHLFE